MEDNFELLNKLNIFDDTQSALKRSEIEDFSSRNEIAPLVFPRTNENVRRERELCSPQGDTLEQLSKDIILYANIYINNNCKNYYEYLNLVCDLQQLAFECIPYEYIIVEDNLVKHLTGSVHIRNKIFQFKCRICNISCNEINKIINNFYNNDFFYVNWFYINTERNESLDLFNTKNENMINKLYLLSFQRPLRFAEANAKQIAELAHLSVHEVNGNPIQPDLD